MTTATDEACRLYSEARGAIRANERSVAIQKLRSSSVLAPHYKTYELLGECLLQEGGIAEAVLYLSAATGLGNKQTRFRYLLARALIRLDPSRAADAIEKLEEALAINLSFGLNSSEPVRRFPWRGRPMGDEQKLRCYEH